MDCENGATASILGSVVSEDGGETVTVDIMGNVQGFSLSKGFTEATILDLNGDNGNGNGFDLGEWEQEHKLGHGRASTRFVIEQLGIDT